MVKKEKSAIRTIQVIDRAVRVLELLADAPEGLGLYDISRKLSVSPQTCQTLLRTLQFHEMVIQAGKGKPYVTGPKIQTLSSQWLSRKDKAGLARELVIKLARKTGELSLLVELRGNVAVPIVEVKSDSSLSVTSETKALEHLHAMATGKILLAFAEGHQRELLLQQVHLRKLASKTITNKNIFNRHLEKVYKQGYAFCINEGNEGVGAVAVPVYDSKGNVAAALGSSIPMVRFNYARQKILLSELLSTARKIKLLW